MVKIILVLYERIFNGALEGGLKKKNLTTRVYSVRPCTFGALGQIQCFYFESSSRKPEPCL